MCEDGWRCKLGVGEASGLRHARFSAKKGNPIPPAIMGTAGAASSRQAPRPKSQEEQPPPQLMLELAARGGRGLRGEASAGRLPGKVPFLLPFLFIRFSLLKIAYFVYFEYFIFLSLPRLSSGCSHLLLLIHDTDVARPPATSTVSPFSLIFTPCYVFLTFVFVFLPSPFSLSTFVFSRACTT